MPSLQKFENGFSNKIGLPALAAKSQIQRNFIWLSVLALLLITIATLPVELLSWYLWKEFDTDPVIDMTVFALGLNQLTVVCLIFLVVKYREKRPFADLGFHSQRPHSWLTKYGIGFAQGMAMMMGLALFIYLFDGFELIVRSNESEGIEHIGWQNLPSILFILLGWLVQGATEEILVRGWMMPLLAYRYNVPFAIVVSSLFFVALHLLNGGIDVLPIINLWLYSVFASLYVIKTKSLWAICGLHSAWNWVQGNVLGILVSGNTVVGGSIIALFPLDDGWLSGGDFGIEGSIFTSVLFFVLSVYLVKLIADEKASNDSITKTEQ